MLSNSAFHETPVAPGCVRFSPVTDATVNRSNTSVVSAFLHGRTVGSASMTPFVQPASQLTSPPSDAPTVTWYECVSIRPVGEKVDEGAHRSPRSPRAAHFHREAAVHIFAVARGATRIVSTVVEVPNLLVSILVEQKIVVVGIASVQAIDRAAFVRFTTEPALVEKRRFASIDREIRPRASICHATEGFFLRPPRQRLSHSASSARVDSEGASDWPAHAARRNAHATNVNERKRKRALKANIVLDTELPAARS